MAVVADEIELEFSTIIVSINWLPWLRSKSTSEYSDVCSSERCITKCIKHWVDGRIDVAQVVGPLPYGVDDHILFQLPWEDRLNENQDTVR